MKGGGDAPSAARAVLQTGDYNVAWNLQVEPAILNQLSGGGKGRVEQLPNWGIERIHINMTDPVKEVNGQRSEKNTPHPFQADKMVRQAYNLLCDRQTVADTLYGPAGKPTANWLTQPAIYNSPNTSWEFNVEAAEQLLDEAGWAKSGQYRAKDGVEMSVIYQTSINSVRQKHQQLIKDAFEQAGIMMELKSVDAAVYFSSDPGNPDTASHFYADLEMHTSAPDIDPMAFMTNFATDQIAQKENSWNLSNVSRWTNEEYDTLLAEARTELDPEKRAEQFIRMNDILIEEVALIPQIDRLGPIALSNDLQGLELSGWAGTNWNVANWTMG
jgi:peptide/nickel transport system substrate-binding protein